MLTTTTPEGNIPGTASLDQQETTLNDVERLGALKLKTYSMATANGAPKHENTATFEDRGDDILPLLKLVEIPANSTKGKTKEHFPDHDALFTTDIWVSNVVKKVLVMRAK